MIILNHYNCKEEEVVEEVGGVLTRLGGSLGASTEVTDWLMVQLDQPGNTGRQSDRARCYVLSERFSLHFTVTTDNIYLTGGPAASHHHQTVTNCASVLVLSKYV